MPTGNFDEHPSNEGAAAPAPASSRVPARYYDPASKEPRPPLVPRWLTLGCGGVSLLLLLAMFAGSAALSSGGFGQVFDLMLSMMQSEASRMYAEDVTAAQKEAFEREAREMRRLVGEGKLSPVKIDPYLQGLRDASEDKLLRSDEVQRLTDVARRLNTAPTVKR